MSNYSLYLYLRINIYRIIYKFILALATKYIKDLNNN